MPHEPAVGAATMRPMAAFHSATATAFASAPHSAGPHSPAPPPAKAAAMRWASPPERPLALFTPGARPWRTLSRITARFWRICSYRACWLRSVLRACAASTTAEMGTFCASASAASAARESK